MHKAKSIFKGLFSEKLFLEQLCYFKDINYSEEVNFIDNNHVSVESVKETLINSVMSY